MRNLENWKKQMRKRIIFTLVFLCFLISTAKAEGNLEKGFKDPPINYKPETWFHLIGGNVAKPGLTADLEAIKKAGCSGIQLFHGQFGGPWPNVAPQVVCLSPSWDDMIS